MKILVADRFPEERLEDFRALGVELDYRPELQPRDLPAALEGATVLVVRGKKVEAAVFDAGGPLALVVRAGAGVNTIDVKAASRRGVFVANCPGQNAIAVAELTLGLLLALDRRIPDAVAALREGRWEKKAYSEARGLYGRTLGLAGLGAIGEQVARRARALGMKVTAWSRSLDATRAEASGVAWAPDLKLLASRCDALSLHLPLNDQTRGIVSRDVLEAMRPGALLVNTARAELIDEAALVERVRSGFLRVGADVWRDEPGAGQAAYSSELASLPGVYGLPHIGASTDQAQDAVAREAVRIVAAFLADGRAPHCVNLARPSPARWQLVVRHYDKVGVLANVLEALKEAGLNAQELENTVFEGAHTACCRIRLDVRPPEELLARIRGPSDEVISAECLPLPIR